jgi:hypothetical protein
MNLQKGLYSSYPHFKDEKDLNHSIGVNTCHQENLWVSV